MFQRNFIKIIVAVDRFWLSYVADDYIRDYNEFLKYKGEPI